MAEATRPTERSEAAGPALLVQVVLQLGALAARDLAVGLRLAFVLTNLAGVLLPPESLARGSFC